jgi:hypothetical protein
MTMMMRTEPVIDHERAMCELLLAAVPGTSKRLTQLASEALDTARRCVPELPECHPHLYRIAARMIREGCVRLGVPLQHYTSTRWRSLGL